VNPSGNLVELFRSGSVSSVTVIGPRAFVTFFGTGQQVVVVELGSGRVVRHTVPGHLLAGPGETIVG
jgi:hypothetical protein